MHGRVGAEDELGDGPAQRRRDDGAAQLGRDVLLVRVRADGDLVCIDVVDAGEGVPEEFRQRLFREFSRADDAVATGTGLGLYVTRTLAEAIEQTTVATRRFARRQDSWFRKDPRIVWVAHDDPDRVEKAVGAVERLGG